MISVYNLAFYCTSLEASRSRNLPITKKRIELQNRLRKCRSKTKRKILLQKYHDVKSLCLGLMYGTSIKRLEMFEKIMFSHRIPTSMIGSCDIPNMQFNFKKVEKSVDKFLQNKHKFIQRITSSKSEFEKKYYSALAKAGLVENYTEGGGWETIVIKECNREKARAILKEVSNSILKEALEKSSEGCSGYEKGSNNYEYGMDKRFINSLSL